jgi:trehalose 6-phosphate synthase
MGRSALVVASNRGPLTVEAVIDADDEIRRGGGGLVSGMQAALQASPDAVWVCSALNDRERQLARQAKGGRLSELSEVADALHGDFDVAMLPIDGQTFRLAYDGIANATLWFILHMLYEPARTPIFDAHWRRQWAAYVRFNQSFADAIAREAGDGATVMVQDYHLFLVPKLLRAARADLRISHFTHTPWVRPDSFRMLPDDVARELLEGMLGADLIGFHTERWADGFAACCRAILDVDPKDQLGVFALSTDAEELTERGHRRDVDAAVRRLRTEIGDRQVIGRVDRTELSKNVYRGLLAYRELLRTYPEWRGRVVHAVFDYPSREGLPEYREYTALIERLGRQIDDEFATDDWTPLLLEIGEDYPAALASLRLSDVIFVNSVRDGMNLVVLEGIVLAEGDPVVVLSRETGAAESLGADAILVNPFDITQSAAALHRALSMPAAERARRAVGLRRNATALPPTQWFQAQLDALSQRAR